MNHITLSVDGHDYGIPPLGSVQGICAAKLKMNMFESFSELQKPLVPCDIFVPSYENTGNVEVDDIDTRQTESREVLRALVWVPYPFFGPPLLKDDIVRVAFLNSMDTAPYILSENHFMTSHEVPVFDPDTNPKPDALETIITCFPLNSSTWLLSDGAKTGVFMKTSSGYQRIFLDSTQILISNDSNKSVLVEATQISINGDHLVVT